MFAEFQFLFPRTQLTSSLFKFYIKPEGGKKINLQPAEQHDSAGKHLELGRVKKVSFSNQAKRKPYQDTDYPTVWMSLEAIVSHMNN